MRGLRMSLSDIQTAGAEIRTPKTSTERNRFLLSFIFFLFTKKSIFLLDLQFGKDLGNHRSEYGL